MTGQYFMRENRRETAIRLSVKRVTPCCKPLRLRCCRRVISSGPYSTSEDERGCHSPLLIYWIRSTIVESGSFLEPVLVVTSHRKNARERWCFCTASNQPCWLALEAMGLINRKNVAVLTCNLTKRQGSYQQIDQYSRCNRRVTDVLISCELEPKAPLFSP